MFCCSGEDANGLNVCGVESKPDNPRILYRTQNQRDWSTPKIEPNLCCICVGTKKRGDHSVCHCHRGSFLEDALSLELFLVLVASEICAIEYDLDVLSDKTVKRSVEVRLRLGVDEGRKAFLGPDIKRREDDCRSHSGNLSLQDFRSSIRQRAFIPSVPPSKLVVLSRSMTLTEAKKWGTFR